LQASLLLSPASATGFGKTDPENVGAIGVPALLLTRDQKDQLYVASGKNLGVYSLNVQGKLVGSVSAREKFFVQAAVVDPDGSLYVLSDDGPVPVIRHLSADGRLLHKLDSAGDALSVLWSEDQRTKDQQVQWFPAATLTFLFSPWVDV